MKKTSHFFCPSCGATVFSSSPVSPVCCNRALPPLPERKAEEGEKLSVEKIDSTEIHIHSPHPMTKDNYVRYVSYETGDELLVRKLYPEWDLSIRLPYLGHGRISWYSEKEGLLYMLY